MLRLSEEIILLMIDENTDRLHRVPGNRLNLALAGATLMDLALENRIDTDPQQLVVTDATPVEDPLLDPALLDIAAAPGVHDISFWLQHISLQGEDIREKALSRLVERGIIDSREGDFHFLATGVSRTRFYPPLDGEITEEVRLRIMRSLFTGEIPGPRDIAIISLLNACGQFDKFLTISEMEEARERIRLISQMDLVGRAVVDSVRFLAAEPEPPESPRSTEVPVVRGLPVIGSAITLSRRGNQFFVDNYRKYGPVYRFKALNRNIVVMSGENANRFVSENGASCLESYWSWREFHQDLGSKRDVISMDGPEQSRLRKTLAPGYSRGLAEQDLEAICAVIREEVRKWTTQPPAPAFYSMQRIVTLSLGRFATGFSAEQYIDDLIKYFYIVLATRVARLRPKFLYSLQFRKLQKRVHALFNEVLDFRASGNGAGPRKDLAADILELHRVDPQFLPETDVRTVMMAPFLAGLETMALSAAFALYALLKHPELMEQVRAEADDFFGGEGPSQSKLRQMEVTHRVALETLRMYPLGTGLSRTVSNTFDFDGYRINAGDNVLVATTVPHFLDEHFANPERFDIERFNRERAEHRQRYAYVPFGLAEHRCLGAGLADLLMMLIPATVLREVELEMVPRNWEIKALALPAMRTKSFRLSARPRAGSSP